MGAVTAVIPCFNSAAYIAEAIESARSQTVPPDQVVVVDDGSTDGSPEAAARAGAEVICSPVRKGAGGARNLGIRRAETRFVAFLDADDVWLPHHCATMLALAEEHPDAAVLFGRIQRFGADGDVPTHRRIPLFKEAALPDLLADNPIPTSAAMAKRELLEGVGGFQEDRRFAEDYDLWLRLAEQYPLVGSDAITCRYREHPQQITLVGDSMVRRAWQARLAARERLMQAGRFDNTHRRLMELALEEDSRRAWRRGDRPMLEEFLDLAQRLDARPAVARAIRTRLLALPLRRAWLSAETLGRAVLGRD